MKVGERGADPCLLVSTQVQAGGEQPGRLLPVFPPFPAVGTAARVAERRGAKVLQAAGLADDVRSLRVEFQRPPPFAGSPVRMPGQPGHDAKQLVRMRVTVEVRRLLGQGMRLDERSVGGLDAAKPHLHRSLVDEIGDPSAHVPRRPRRTAAQQLVPGRVQIADGHQVDGPCGMQLTPQRAAAAEQPVGPLEVLADGGEVTFVARDGSQPQAGYGQGCVVVQVGRRVRHGPGRRRPVFWPVLAAEPGVEHARDLPQVPGRAGRRRAAGQQFEQRGVLGAQPFPSLAHRPGWLRHQTG